MFLKPDYPALPALAGVLAAAFVLPAAAGLAVPVRAARFWKAFPRDKVAGWILTVIAMAWTSLWLPVMLGDFVPALAPGLLPYIQIFFIVAVIATGFALNNLLACRAAGLIMVLVPAPLLSAAQWNVSPWRLPVIVTAYAIAVAGMFVVSRPWYLRDAITYANATPKRTRLFSAAFALLGVLLAICAIKTGKFSV